MSRDPAWRDEASARLAAGELRRPAAINAVLIVDDLRDDVADAAIQAGASVVRWDRMAGPGRAAQPWPPEGVFDLIAIRLPRSKPWLDLIFAAVLPRLRASGRVLLYGAKDEGIRSATKRIEAITGAWTTRATGGHARLLEWVSPPGFQAPILTEDSPESRRQTIRIDLGDGPRDWFTWPGAFGATGIDGGTALLLDHLPESHGPVMDFAAGTGVLGAAMVAAGTAPGDLILTEPDALAARAAELNVPGVRLEVVAGWPEVGEVGTVVSNPPYHEGKVESVSVVEALIRGAAKDLRPGGELRMVVQKRLQVEEMLQHSFATVRVIADQGAFRVWSARRR